MKAILGVGHGKGSVRAQGQRELTLFTLGTREGLATHPPNILSQGLGPRRSRCLGSDPRSMSRV